MCAPAAVSDLRNANHHSTVMQDSGQLELLPWLSPPQKSVSICIKRPPAGYWEDRPRGLKAKKKELKSHKLVIAVSNYLSRGGCQHCCLG